MGSELGSHVALTALQKGRTSPLPLQHTTFNPSWIILCCFLPITHQRPEHVCASEDAHTPPAVVHHWQAVQPLLQ